MLRNGMSYGASMLVVSLATITGAAYWASIGVTSESGAHHSAHVTEGHGASPKTAANQPAHSQHDEHAAHRAALAKARYSIKTSEYAIPDVKLVDQTGSIVDPRTLLDGDSPVALNFIFTTCTTICPVMTATFAQMLDELGERAASLRVVSISIDPEYDRPEVLAAYAAQYGAAKNWTFLTGDSADIGQVLVAFDAFAGSKMNHQPATLLKRAGASSWVRIDGLASGAELAKEVVDSLLD